MKFSLVSGAAALALVLGTAAAFAQTQSPMNNQGSAYNPNEKAPPAVYGQDSVGGASANKNKNGYSSGSAQSPQGGQMANDSDSSQKKSQ
jgi:hypothetical protein